MNFNSTASQAILAIQYKNVKLSNTIQNIKFNKDCLRHDLKPNYIHVKINNKSHAAKRALASAEKLWIKYEIKSLYRKKELLNKLVYRKYLEFANNSHTASFALLLDEVNMSVSRIIRNKRVTQRKKFTNLMNLQKPREYLILNNITFYPRTINKTDISFTDEELTVLNKGLNFNLPQVGKKGIFNELINTEVAIKSIPDEDVRNASRLHMAQRVNGHPRFGQKLRLNAQQKHDYTVLGSIKDKLTDNNALLCKADKGHTTVILYRDDYNTKVKDFINKNEIHTLTRDPTNVYQSKIKQLINNSKILLTEDDIKYLKMINPKAPPLHGLPKVHKPDVPIRPLVDYTTAPTFKIAKKLEGMLKEHVTLANNYSVKNCYELVDKTKNLKIMNHHILASFDVVNLYTNVPVNDTLDIVERNLRNSSLLPEAVDEFLALLKETLKQNYFQFNGSFYSQTDGLAMGSPLSGVLADIYLNHIENEFIFSNKNKLKDKIMFYHRYVDDTLLLFNGNVRQLEKLHNYLNTLAPKLKFTLEIEQDNRINFLDLTLEKNNNKFDYKIYRKPTTSDQTIHFSSFHPYSQKMAAYNSLVYRLLKVPLSTSNYENELKIIKHIATANGYRSNLIDKLVAKKRDKIRNTGNNEQPINNNESMNSSKFVCVEYSHNIDHGLKKTLNNQNIKLTFRTTNKIRNILQPKTTNNDKYRRSGVYRIKCSDCTSVYVGQTGRAFKTRYKEHYPAPKTTKQKSSFAQHLVDHGHDISDIENNMDILHICNKGKKLDTLEEFEIYRHFQSNKNNILNDKLQFSSHSIFNTITSSQVFMNTNTSCSNNDHPTDSSSVQPS